MAANAANALDAISSKSGWLALGTGVMTAAAGVGEIPSAGADTPATAVLAGATGLLGTISTITGGAAAAFNSFAKGNLNAVGTFTLSQLTSLRRNRGCQ